MKYTSILFIVKLSAVFAQQEIEKHPQALTHEIAIADSIFFQSLNNCDLKTYASFLPDDFEFYHDRGGLTKSKEAELNSIRSFCGEQRQRQRLRRELVRSSLEVNPVKGYGAIEVGRHYFYLVIDDKTEKLIRGSEVYKRLAKE